MPTKKMNIYETHAHTPLCKHAVGEPEAYALAAQQRGLKGIIFTCHNPMPDGWGAGVRMLESEFPVYVDLIARAREAMRGRVDVRLGLECDYVPGMESYLEKQIASAPLQYVLGSIHPHMSSYRNGFWKNDPRGFQALYFEHLALAAESRLFDTLAHPDLIKMALPEHWSFEQLRPDICRALDRIARTGIAMELNTSGLTKAPSEMNPGPEMLREMCAREIPLVIGADAHKPERVAADFERALDHAEDAGYQDVHYVLERKRHAIRIKAMRRELRAPQLQAMFLILACAALCAGRAAAVELPSMGVIPIIAGPMQTLLAILPGLLVALGGLAITLLNPKTVWKFLQLLWRQKLPLAGVAAAASLCVWVSGELWSPHSGATVAAGSEEFPLFRGGMDRRGWTQGAEDPTQGGIVWSQKNLGSYVFSSPAVAGPYIYAATTSQLSQSGGSGQIGCFDARTGDVVWKDASGNLRATYASPAVSGKYVVCGEGLHFVKDARVVCLERATGKVIWQFSTKQHVESTPCLYKDKVFVGAGEDGYYALALEGDGQGGPKVVWHRTREEGYEDCETSPVALDGRVYVGLGIAGQAVVCFDAESGKELWRLKTPAPVFSPPTIANGKLFVGMGFGDMIKSAEDLGKPEEGEVWCIDLAHPEKPLWTAKSPRTVLGAVAVGNGCAYFASRDGWCMAVQESDGKEVGRWNAQAQIMTSPAVASRHIYFVTRNGMLYALDAESFRPVWQTTLWKNPSTEAMHFSSPTVAHGHIYVGSASEGLLCLGEPGQPQEKMWLGFQGGAGKSGRVDKNPLAKQYETAWTFSNAESVQITAPAAFQDGAFYLPTQNGDKCQFTRLNLNSTDSSATPSPAWTVDIPGTIGHAPAVRDRAAYVVAREGAQATVIALDRANGKERWRYQGQVSGELQLDGPRLLAAVLDNGLVCLKSNGSDEGSVLWSFTGGTCVGAPAAADGRVFLTLTGPSRLTVLDAETGIQLWTVPLLAEGCTGPVLSGETICVGTKEGVAGFSILDGTLRWKFPETGIACQPLAVKDDLACALSEDGRLSLIHAGDGRVVKVIPGVTGKLMPMLSDEGLYFAARSGFARATLDDSPIREVWFKLAGQEKALTPPLVVGGQVFIGTNKGWTFLKRREP